MRVNKEYFKDFFFGYYKERIPFTFKEVKKLESCSACLGIGRISREELSDYHKREYDIFHEDCKHCAGEGRLIVTKIYVDIGDIPYSNKRGKDACSLHNLLFQVIEEPYTKAAAKDIEKPTPRKQFWFNIEDVKEQMFYLGNFRIDSYTKEDVELAAKKLKRDIRFMDTPMPINNPKIKIDEKYVSGFGCIAVYDDKKDNSKFWLELNKIRKLRETEKSA